MYAAFSCMHVSNNKSLWSQPVILGHLLHVHLTVSYIPLTMCSFLGLTRDYSYYVHIINSYILFISGVHNESGGKESRSRNRPRIELNSQDLHMMDVLLKLELGAYVTCVCTLSRTAGVHGECQWSHWSGLPWWQEESSATTSIVLDVPAISPRISPTMVNIRMYTAYRTGSILVTRPSCVNLGNSIKCVGDSCSYLFTIALIMRSCSCT